MEQTSQSRNLILGCLKLHPLGTSLAVIELQCPHSKKASFKSSLWAEGKHKNHLRTEENVFLLAWSVYLIRKEDWDVTRLRCINAFMSKKYSCMKGDFHQAEEYITRTNCLEAEARKFKSENKDTFLTVRVNR